MNLEVAQSVWARMRGLIGRPSFEGVLLLVPCHDIHTFGMKRPIDIAFVAADGTVIESHRNVGPRLRLKNRKAAATLERFSAPSPWYVCGDRIQNGRIENTR